MVLIIFPLVLLPFSSSPYFNQLIFTWRRWEIRLNRQNETQFLPGCGRIDTAIWMHYMDSNKTAGEEARRQLHKNAVSNLEQVLAATPHKTPTVRPPASYHENYSSYTNQTCRTLLEKQGRTHKWCTLMDPHIWPSKSRTTSTNKKFSNYVRIRDVAMKTCQRRWTIGRRGERGSGISMLETRQDDDDDEFLHCFKRLPIGSLDKYQMKGSLRFQ